MPASPRASQNVDGSEKSAKDVPEIAAQRAAATFQVKVNLVEVRVVVRDAQGHVVPGLKKEDFQLLDNGKPQTIAKFAVEQPSSTVPN